MDVEFWNGTLGDYFISEITPALIYQAREKLISNPSHSEKAKNSKQKKYFKSATINRHQAALSSVFNRAVMEWGYVTSNPVLQVKRLKEKNQRQRYLEKDEIKASERVSALFEQEPLRFCFIRHMYRC